MRNIRLITFIIPFFIYQNSFANLKCSQVLKVETKNPYSRQLSNRVSKKLELQLALELQWFINAGWYSFKKGNRAYAQEIVKRLNNEGRLEKDGIIKELQKRSTVYHAPHLYDVDRHPIENLALRVLIGKDQSENNNNIITRVLNTNGNKALKQFIEDNIDSIIMNAITIKTVPYPVLLQRVLSLCTGAGCSLLAQQEPSVVFALLASIPARELLRRENPLVIGFQSSFNE